MLLLEAPQNSILFFFASHLAVFLEMLDCELFLNGFNIPIIGDSWLPMATCCSRFHFSISPDITWIAACPEQSSKAGEPQGSIASTRHQQRTTRPGND
jgi:hypothetical protein